MAAALPPFASEADRAAAIRFFRDRDAAHRTFHALAAQVANFGACQMVATKSRVAFLRSTRFLWCHEAHLDGTITVGFLLPNKVESPRLRSAPVGGRVSHHVKFGALDPELRSWFKAAYDWDAKA